MSERRMGARLRHPLLHARPEVGNDVARERLVVDARQGDVAAPGRFGAVAAGVAADAEPVGARSRQLEGTPDVDLRLQFAVDVDARLAGLLVVDADQMVVGAACGGDVAAGPSPAVGREVRQEGQLRAAVARGDEEARAARLHRAEGLDLAAAVGLGVEHDEHLERVSVGERLAEGGVGRVVHLVVARGGTRTGVVVEAGDVVPVAVVVVGQQARAAVALHDAVRGRAVGGRAVVVEDDVEQIGRCGALRDGDRARQVGVPGHGEGDECLPFRRVAVFGGRECQRPFGLLLRKPVAGAALRVGHGGAPRAGVRRDGQCEVTAADRDAPAVGRDREVGFARRLLDGERVHGLLAEVETHFGLPCGGLRVGRGGQGDLRIAAARRGGQREPVVGREGLDAPLAGGEQLQGDGTVARADLHQGGIGPAVGNLEGERRALRRGVVRFARGREHRRQYAQNRHEMKRASFHVLSQFCGSGRSIPVCRIKDTKKLRNPHPKKCVVLRRGRAAETK